MSCISGFFFVGCCYLVRSTKVHVHLYWYTYMKNCGANPDTMLHDYMNISKHFYVCVYVCVHVFCKCMCLCMCVYACVHMFECVFVLMSLCVYVNVSVCACVSRGLTCMCLLFRASI